MPRRVKTYMVHGEGMTIDEAARSCHVPRKTIVYYMGGHRCSLQQAFDHFSETEPRRTKKAVREILSVIYEEG